MTSLHSYYCTYHTCKNDIVKIVFMKYASLFVKGAFSVFKNLSLYFLFV